MLLYHILPFLALFVRCCLKSLPFLNIMTVVTHCNSLHNQIFLNFEMGGNFSFISIKQMFQFENFRVRKLRAINALNFYITLCMAFLAMISMESETSAVKVSIIKSADPVKRKVYFCYYRLAKGIRGILSYAKEGVRLWFRTKRPAYRQICLKLVA